MDEKNTVKSEATAATALSARAHHAGDGGAVAGPVRRFSAQRKLRAVQRLFRGESLEAVSRDPGVPVHRLTKWRDRAFAGAESALKDRARGGDRATSGQGRRNHHGQRVAIREDRQAGGRPPFGPTEIEGMVILPFLTGRGGRTYAAIFSFIAGVMPPMPIFGRSLLYVHSHCVAKCWASSMLSMMYWSSHSCRTVRL